tara:strand:+ start:1444 stop:1998 length:555 start_codon:yes stop_codon:yes gene_type:complete
MNSTPEATDPPAPASKPKKQISAQRRIISWIFIVILMVIVLLEWRAKSSQANTVDNLEAAMTQAGDIGEITFVEFQTIKEGSPSEDVDESGAILRKHHYRWNGIFKTYDLRILVNDEDMVITYDTLADGEAVGGINRISKKRMEALIQKEKNGSGEKPAETEPEEAKPAETEPVQPKPEETKKN